MFTAKVAAIVLLAHSPAWSITIAPGKVALPSGHAFTTTVFDTGRHGLNIEMKLARIERIHGRCTVILGKPPWASASPQHFALRPGGRQVVRVRIAREGTTGAHDLAVMAQALPDSHGMVRISGAVATQALAVFPGKSHGKPCVTLPAVPTQHRFPAWSIWLAVTVLALALLTALWAIILRHQRNTRRGSTA